MSAEIVSVNVSLPRVLQEQPRLVSSIDKRPVDGPVRVEELGLAGDDPANKKHHGGPFQAVYAVAEEDQSWWASSSAGRSRPAASGRT